jgi:carbon monoxide dehydrogenase subunit G
MDRLATSTHPKTWRRSEVELEQSFEVAAPVERVWQALIDVEHVAPCLPGAAVTGRNDDGSYNGTFTIKIGPTTASYTGKLEMDNVDEGARSATLHAQGTDKRGQGGAKATITSSVAEAGDGLARVQVHTDYHITGRLARFGRGGMIEDISERLLKEFAGRLQSSLAGGAEPAVDSDLPFAGEEEVPEPTDEAPPPTDAPQQASPPPPPPPPAPAPPSEPLQAHDVVGPVLLARIRQDPRLWIAAAAVLLLIRRRRRRRRRMRALM